MSTTRERARTFVALPLGAELGALVAARIAETLDGTAYRLARSEGLHLTLFFLGDVFRGDVFRGDVFRGDVEFRGDGEPERLAVLAAALRTALSGRLAPALRLSGTGAFPSQARARVLWVGVEERAHPGRLEVCRQAVLGGLARAGVAPGEEERGTFRPHVSVARPRGRRRLPSEFGTLSLGFDWDPTGVELLESRRGSAGSRYECLERFPFSRAE